jgi:hypothetical protein
LPGFFFVLWVTHIGGQTRGLDRMGPMVFLPSVIKMMAAER